MKIFFIIIFLIATNLPAQTLFPLHVGNKWIYGELIDTNVYNREVKSVADTLLSNGKIYSTLSSKGNNSFYRQTGDSVFQFDPSFENDEILLFDFSLAVGDTINNINLSIQNDTLQVVLVSKDNREYFGRSRNICSFFVNQTLFIDDEVFYEVVDSIGITGISYVTWGSEFLKGALINGKIYGDINPVSVFERKVHPKEFFLSQNYPNPFNPETIISYTLKSSGFIQLKIFDSAGKMIKTIVNKFQSPNSYSVRFNAQDLASGVYYYQLLIGNEKSETKKMLLLR